MKLLTFKTDAGLKLGVKTDKGILDVEKAAAANEDYQGPLTIQQFIEGGQDAHSRLEKLVQVANQDFLLPEEELQIGPCVPSPGKIICVGLNYRKHAEESNMPIPEYPILFNKFNNTIAAPGEEIPLPPESSQVDYEAELTIVIGKKAKRVKQEEALEYAAGYCNVNDLSARDLQFRTNQWLLGKSCDGFSPIGPYLVTADEVGNPNDLQIKSIVNGEVRQDSHTSDMIFSCDQIISYISHHMTLEPGDIILTGTPEGVIMGYPKDQQVWLKAGDVVTIEIEKLGSLTNSMKNEI